MPKQGTRSLYRNISQTVFKVEPPRSSNFSTLDLYLCGRLQTPAYSSPIESEEIFTNAFFMPVEPFKTAAGRFKVCGLP